ncbi:hypothetical protein L798_12860 [Zootermopsis nevadensis]|uniref:Uncharacterized protein n=1 Tax=Zootermopsis nevadensis TaxID=136037 RepID=A0A067QTM5_ZOONE|nr:hypothetical protein L798_12860 [Zootermopsis nevadensis]
MQTEPSRDVEQPGTDNSGTNWWVLNICTASYSQNITECHLGSERPYVSSGDEGFQILKAATNELNKPTWTADRGLPSRLNLNGR